MNSFVFLFPLPFFICFSFILFFNLSSSLHLSLFASASLLPAPFSSPIPFFHFLFSSLLCLPVIYTSFCSLFISCFLFFFLLPFFSSSLLPLFLFYCSSVFPFISSFPSLSRSISFTLFSSPFLLHPSFSFFLPPPSYFFSFLCLSFNLPPFHLHSTAFRSSFLSFSLFLFSLFPYFTSSLFPPPFLSLFFIYRSLPSFPSLF